MRKVYLGFWSLALPFCAAFVASGCITGGGAGSSSTPAASEKSSGANPNVASNASAASVKAVNAGECSKSPLVDDAEDNNNQIAQADKRGGYWYTYKDTAGTTINPTGNFAMSEGGAENSKYAAHMNGKLGKGDVLYAGMGFSFAEPKAPYDVSCCKGVSFWAKKVGAGTGNVRFKMGDANTTPEGGKCKSCYNDFGSDLTLTDQWKKYEISFDSMKQEAGWGEPQPALDKATVFQLQWQVKDAGADYDIWVDKVELSGCGG